MKLLKFSMSHVSRGLLAAVLASALALQGCGGSGAQGVGVLPDVPPPSASSSSSSTSTSTSSGATGAPATSKVALLGNTTTLASDGKTPVELSAVVTSQNNVAEPSRIVEFSVEDPNSNSGVRLEVETSTTDNGGLAKAKLYLLNDSTERTVKVIAKSGSAPQSELLIKVTGNAIALSGPAQVPFNGTPAIFNLTLKDSSGGVIAGKTLTLRSVAGNRLSASTVVTDQSGAASFTVTGTIGGADTIEVTGVGVSATRTMSVSGDSLGIVPASTTIPINTDSIITVNFSNAGGIPAGTVATLATTQGTVATSTQPITSGTASFLVRSTFAGPATLTARVNNSEVTTAVNFVSVTPASITLQPSVSVIGPNVGTSTTQRADLVAVVRDAAGNPVANRRVSFSATQNPSGGIIEPGVSSTDFSGRATSTYIAGPNVTPANGVRIEARIVDSTIAPAQAPLSVSQRQLFVRLGTSNKIGGTEQIYEKIWSAIVTDATGNPVVGATVQAKIRATRYETGYWQFVAANPAVAGSVGGWSRAGTQSFASEDLNLDGVCIPSEDLNSDGILTPGNVVSANSSGVTSSSGVADIVLTYAKTFALWTEVELEATVSVDGSEGRSIERFWLPMAAADLPSDPNIYPPSVSRYVNVNGQLELRLSGPYPYANPRPTDPSNPYAGGLRCGQ